MMGIVQHSGCHLEAFHDRPIVTDLPGFSQRNFGRLWGRIRGAKKEPEMS
jgi:hypothetical protein